MNVQLKHTMTFTAGIYYNGKVSMNNYTLTLRMLTNGGETSYQNIAFERIKYFVYSQLENTIFINQDLKLKIKAFSDCELSITTLPGEPVDQLIGIMLYYKLNAITEGELVILETELGSMLGENISYIHSDYEDTVITDKPEWWTSPDLVHCGPELIDTDKVVTIRQTDSWKDLDLHWPDEVIEVTPQNPTDNTVVFADFKKE